MKNPRFALTAIALVVVLIAAGAFATIRPGGGGTTGTRSTSFGSEAVSVSSIEVQKAGPYGGLLSVAIYDRNDSSCSGCVSEATIGLLYLNSGDDGMAVTNTTAIRVTITMQTPGFHLVNVTLPQVRIASNPVFLPQNGEVDVSLYYTNPANTYSGPVGISFDAESS